MCTHDLYYLYLLYRGTINTIIDYNFIRVVDLVLSARSIVLSCSSV